MTRRASDLIVPCVRRSRSGVPGRARRLWILVCCAGALWSVPLQAQQLLDRVVARVGASIITWSDVQTALGLGLIEGRPGADAEQAAVEQMVDRQLMLAELTRFPPPEPDPQAVDAQVMLLRQRAGDNLADLKESTGLDERRLRALARDTLRIQTYLDQRFGAAFQVSDEDVRRYYEANRSEFTRDGVVVPFAQVESTARLRAAAQRRSTVIDQWLRDLRARTNVVVVRRR